MWSVVFQSSLFKQDTYLFAVSLFEKIVSLTNLVENFQNVNKIKITCLYFPKIQVITLCIHVCLEHTGPKL